MGEPVSAKTESTFELVWQGVSYRVEDLELNDIAEMEDELGDSVIDLLNSGRMRPLLYMVWLIRRRAEPDLKLEDVGKVKMGAIIEDQMEAAGPPTVDAVEPVKKSGSGGSRGTRASTASARGNSDA